MLLFSGAIDSSADIAARLDLPHGGFGVIIGGSAKIGSDAIIFHNVTIGSAHPGPIDIGDRVYIGTGAIILGPIIIGSDVRIGAGAVVRGENIPDRSIVKSPKSSLIFPSISNAKL